MTYQQAFDKLTELLDNVEQERVPLDQLPDTIRQAGELLAFCQARLRQVEDKLTQATERPAGA